MIMAVSVIVFVLRLGLGLIFLSSGIGKLARLSQFRQGILDYQIALPMLESHPNAVSTISTSIPLIELLIGICALLGVIEPYAALLGCVALIAFSVAVFVNLLRGRRDLSCHCSGVLGNHTISWWLLLRNGLIILSLSVIAFSPYGAIGVIALTPSQWSSLVLPTLIAISALGIGIGLTKSIARAMRL